MLCSMACTAPVTLEMRFLAPALHVSGHTMRARQHFLGTLIDPTTSIVCRLDFVEEAFDL